MNMSAKSFACRLSSISSSFSLLILAVVVFPLLTPFSSANAQDDRAIVRSILDKNGRKGDDVEAVAEFGRDGRALVLKLDKRGLSGVAITAFPIDVFKLTALKGLFLKGNALTSIPAEIGNMTQLVELNLADNSDLGSLPASIGNLINLQKLDIRYCGLSDLPPEFGNLKKLEYLQMWGNIFTELPFCIVEMASLKELYLKNNKLTSLPQGLIKLDKLNYVDTHLNYLCKLPPDVEAWLVSRDKRYKDNQYCDNVKQ